MSHVHADRAFSIRATKSGDGSQLCAHAHSGAVCASLHSCSGWFEPIAAGSLHGSRRLGRLATGVALIQPDGSCAIGRALAGGEKGLPLNSLWIFDPALLALGVAASRRALFENRSLCALQARI